MSEKTRASENLTGTADRVQTQCLHAVEGRFSLRELVEMRRGRAPVLFADKAGIIEFVAEPGVRLRRAPLGKYTVCAVRS